jgi:hypothetical protein
VARDHGWQPPVVLALVRADRRCPIFLGQVRPLSGDQTLAPGNDAVDISAFAAAVATTPAAVPELSSPELSGLAIGGFATFRRHTQP